MALVDVIGRAFKVTENGTTVMRESYAGLLLFITISYILLVNPPIMVKAGMDIGVAYSATCVIAIIGTLIITLFARHPAAIIPTMGLNTFFAYTMVMVKGYTWQQALAVSFIAGMVYFILVCIRPFREAINKAISPDLCKIFIAGIGAYIAFVGLKAAGIIVSNPNTIIGLGDGSSPAVIVSLIGTILLIVLVFRKVKGAMLIGVVATVIMSIIAGTVAIPSQVVDLPSAPPIGAFLDGFGNLPIDMVLVQCVFSIVMVVLFDSHGCIMSAVESSGKNEGKTVERMTIGNAVSAVVAPIVGSCPSAICAESTVATENGGRTALTGVIVALLFAVALFFQPLFGTITSRCVAPIVIVVGLLMLMNVWKVEKWDTSLMVAALVCIMVMVLSCSICDGMGWGLIFYCIMKAVEGRWRELPKETYALAALFVIFFVARILSHVHISF